MFRHIDHVGLVVNTIDEGLATYCNLLGFTLLERRAVPEHGVEVAFLDAGNITLELLAPTDPASGTARFLQNRGEGVHHICFVVDDIYAALDQLRAQGLRLIDESPRQGIHGLVAFVHPKATHGAMLELLQLTEH
ncbi:MAG: methylmalonyl-CoA epimerase [Caldilineaceae bacterium]|nr:methylmalonyl-CoA epimerase [Caldilineaceae bacterium]